MQLASTGSPRSVSSSDTCWYASGYRKYQRTAVTITWPGYCRPLNGLRAVIGTASTLPTRPPKLRNGIDETVNARNETTVAPHEGAWIETSDRQSPSAGDLVAPH